MTQAGEVIDPKKGKSDFGRRLQGLNDWEGEIADVPVRSSRAAQLQNGMPMCQMMDMLGATTDRGVYVMGKTFIPFFFGSDRHRRELVCRDQSRLIFAGTSGMNTNAYLNWIIPSADETGCR